MNVENDVITAESVEDAKEQFEDMIIEYIEDEISRLESMLEKFREEKSEVIIIDRRTWKEFRDSDSFGGSI